ncbi:hypothetical protein [Streptomyces sp. NPDC051567]|uniref:hypothetical protein n=1 Tax=Streptomyces sp. NPDC051567 TaxID=3365660 RepID=UPI0037A57E3D
MSAVVLDVVTQYAPQERQLVEWLARLDEDEVVRLLRRRRGEDPLGFGLSEAVAVVTPVVWLAVDEAFRGLIGAAAVGLAARLGRLVRRTPPLSAGMPKLSREQLAVVHRRVLEGAAGAGLDRSAADALADGVVARLALDPAPEDNPPEGAVG